MRERRAIVRFDAGPEIGLGHATRSLALAEALTTSGWRCTLAMTQESTEFLPPGTLEPYEVHAVGGGPHGAAELRGFAPSGCDLLVVDGYHLDRSLETGAKEWARRVLAFDDLPNRDHDCDYLLDQTLGRSRADYASRVPQRCVMLLGPRFAPLRLQFAEWRAASLSRDRTVCRRLLVAFGGGDPEGWAARVLEQLTPLPKNITVDVIANATSASFGRTVDAVKRLGAPARVLTSPLCVAEVMAVADLAIGAAGVTSWERCCLGLPALVTVIAENQRDIASGLVRAGAAIGLEAPDIERDRLLELIMSVNAQAMSVRASQICDGEGATRVAGLLSSEAASAEGFH